MSVTLETVPKLVEKILAIKAKFPDNCMAQAFTSEYFNTLNDGQKVRLLNCLKSGIENEDSCMGCYALSPADYDEFKPFFGKALELYHKVDLSKTKHTNNWSLKGV